MPNSETLKSSFIHTWRHPGAGRMFKDKGNYDYISVPDPVISGLDTAYNATSGDSLIICACYHP